MNTRKLPPQEYLRQCFDYDPLTGRLSWRARPADHFQSSADAKRWNAKYAGRSITAMSCGYIVCALQKRIVRAHRVIWALVYGQDAEEIDHINGVRSDNRLVNLRNCSHAENMMNTVVLRVNNRSGFKGVHSWQGKWRAMIRADGRTRHIGIFDTPEEASKAYQAAALRLHGEFARFE